MADTCGGMVTTARVQLGAKALQLVGTLESRTQVTIRAAQENDAAIFITADTRTPWSEGFPLYPGEAYQFGGGDGSRGARAALYGIGPSGGDKIVYVITEGH